MSRWQSPRRASRALAGVLLGLTAPVAAAAPQDATAVAPAAERSVLAATVNGVRIEEPVLVRRIGARAWMRAADLRATGIKIGDVRGDVALDGVPGLTFAIDDAAQTITLTQAGRDRQHIPLAREAVEDAPLTRNGWGATLNYDATASATPRQRNLAGAVDATLFTPHGYGFAGAIAATGSQRAQRKLVRLETGYTFADTGRMLRVTAGDFANAAASFSRPVRMGGVKLGTDFGLRPNLVTFPVPSISASAALPSAVDLIVNGNRRAVGEVRAGQFSVSDIPVVTGVNTVSVAVRDALGRQTLQTVTTYASRALLRPGLSAWSLEGGFVRTGFAGDNDHYRSFAASGSVRHGLTGRITLEGHAEASADVAMAGVGAALTLGSVGMVDASVAVSRDHTKMRAGGTQLEVGFERVGRPVSISARYTKASDSWTDVASQYGSVTRSHALVINLGFDLRRAGAIGLGVIDLGRGRARTDANGVPVDRLATRTAPTTLVNGTYSAKLAGRINLVGNVGVDLRRRRSLFASLGALIVFGPRSSAYIGATARNGGYGASADYILTAMAPGELGYRVSAATGTYDRMAAGVEYLGRQGHVDAQFERTNGETAARASARGSLLLIDGGLYLADTENSGFALVDTAGQAGVTVYRDNRPVGVTGRSGKLLVQQLNAYQSTKFSIDPTQIGNDMTIAMVEQVVRPNEKVGVTVSFDLAVSRAGQVQLVDPSGAPLPAGARAFVAGVDLPVGLDGMLYLARVAPSNSVVVRMPNGHACRASFPAPPSLSPAAVIGPVTCAVQQLATIN